MLQLIREMQIIKTDILRTMKKSAHTKYWQLDSPSLWQRKWRVFISTSALENNLAALVKLHMCVLDEPQFQSEVCISEKLLHVCTKRHVSG